MENKITPPQATPTDNSGLSIDYLVISSPSDTLPYQKAIKEAPLLAIDTETTGLDPHRDRLRLIQITLQIPTANMASSTKARPT